MQITNDRLNHSIAVARKMKKMVEEQADTYSINPEEAFVLGMLHDIGYEFCEVQMEHACKGGELLRNQDYKFWREVYYHGIAQDEYSSQELWLLNYADMTTNPVGEQVTIDERINDIESRYGEDSFQVEEAKKLAKMINRFYK